MANASRALLPSLVDEATELGPPYLFSFSDPQPDGPFFPGSTGAFFGWTNLLPVFRRRPELFASLSRGQRTLLFFLLGTTFTPSPPGVDRAALFLCDGRSPPGLSWTFFFPSSSRTTPALWSNTSPASSLRLLFFLFSWKGRRISPSSPGEAQRRSLEIVAPLDKGLRLLPFRSGRRSAPSLSQRWGFSSFPLGGGFF